MTKKIVLTVTIILALLIAVYKWIMSRDIKNNEEKQKRTEKVKDSANNITENVKGQTEEAKAEDKVNETITNK